jgi:hypothetical protein
MRCPILPHVPSIFNRLINVIQTNSNAIFLVIFISTCLSITCAFHFFFIATMWKHMLPCFIGSYATGRKLGFLSINTFMCALNQGARTSFSKKYFGNKLE